MENNIEWKSFDIFQKEMLNILKQKNKKYNDTWKTSDIYYLKNKLRKQLDSTFFHNPEKVKRAKRQLLHIANYCYFLYTKI